MGKKKSWIVDLILVLAVIVAAVQLVRDEQAPKKTLPNPFQSFPFRELRAIKFPEQPFEIRLGETQNQPILKILPNESFPLSLPQLQAYLDYFLILPEFEIFQMLETEAAYGFGPSPHIQFQFPNQTLNVSLGLPNKLLQGMSYILIDGKAGLLPQILVEKMRPNLSKFLPRNLRAYLKMGTLPLKLRNSLGKKIISNSTKIQTILDSDGLVVDKIPTHIKTSGFSLEITWQSSSQMLMGLIDKDGATYLQIKDGYWLKSRQALLE